MNLYKEPLLFRLVPWFIGFVFLVIVLFWISAGVIAYKVSDEVGTNGLKATLERIWCGANGCK